MTVLDQAARLRELVLRHGFGGLSARVVSPAPPAAGGGGDDQADALQGLLAGAEALANEAAMAPVGSDPEASVPAEAPPAEGPRAAAPPETGEEEASTTEAPLAPSEVGASEAQRMLSQMRPAKAARVVAVASGKGGVGKTHLSCNLAIAAARAGVSTVLVDGDLGMANVDVLLGLGGRRHLGEVLDGSASLDEVVVQHAEGLRILPGASGLADLAELQGQELLACAEALSSLEQGAQLLVLDLGAGVGKTVLAFAAAADELLVVTTPEPTAIADAYGLVKVLGGKLPQLRLQLVVNQAESEAEAKSVALRLQAVVDRFLPEQSLHYLGWVPKDPSVGRAVRAQRAFLEAQPFAPASRAVLQLSERLLGRPLGRPAGGLVARLFAAWGRVA